MTDQMAGGGAGRPAEAVLILAVLLVLVVVKIFTIFFKREPVPVARPSTFRRFPAES